jgi:hypothetical protein
MKHVSINTKAIKKCKYIIWLHEIKLKSVREDILEIKESENQVTETQIMKGQKRNHKGNSLYFEMNENKNTV